MKPVFTLPREARLLGSGLQFLDSSQKWTGTQMDGTTGLNKSSEIPSAGLLQPQNKASTLRMIR